MANKTLSDFPVLTNPDAASVVHVQKELVDYQVPLDTLTQYVTENAEYTALGDKIDGATEKTDPVDADMVGLMDSAAAGNALKKFSWANFKAKLKTYFDALYPSVNGWVSITETWAYASATTITVPTGAASRYSIGDKIKLTQTTVKYFYIVGVADTLLTVTGGIDYTVANAVISGVYYSKIENPLSFPHWFSWTSTITAGSGTPTTVSSSSKFKVSGRTVFFHQTVAIVDKGSASATMLGTLPVSCSSSTGGGSCTDPVLDGASAALYIASSSRYSFYYATLWTNTRSWYIVGFYEI